jgi:hypothetical protein
MSTSRLLGRIALKAVDLQDGTADLAYWMVAAARGRGLCTDSVTTLCQWAFDKVGFHRIELKHSVRNPASCRVSPPKPDSARKVRGAARRGMLTGGMTCMSTPD